MNEWRLILCLALMGIAGWGTAIAEDPGSPKHGSAVISPPEDSDSTISPSAAWPDASTGARQETTASPSRPTWTGGASTSERGEVESDFGWQQQSMGRGVRQSSLPSSIRYGLTSRLELRWGMPAHIAQSGPGSTPTRGITDQGVSALYRFYEQGRRMPALALNYGVKIPSANPAKGFGTGFTDHVLTFVCSRDFGRAHLDFNAVGTVAGEPYGHDGAAQFGLALSVAASRRFTWVIDSYGGPQPGTADRYGAVLSGGTWAVHPWLVLDAAYTHAYTGGAPRQQFTVGLTHAMKPVGWPCCKASKVARLLSR